MSESSGLLEEYKAPAVGKTENVKGRNLTEGARFKAIGDKVLTAQARQQGKSQAILRVTGYLSTAERAQSHASYISRNGDLGLEDEEGSSLSLRDECKDVLKEWAVDFDPVKGKRLVDKLSLIVDASSAEERREAYKALKQFASDHLSEHKVRIDVSRAKESPNRVVLRAEVDPEKTGGVVEQLKDLKGSLGLPGGVIERKGRLPRNAIKMVLSTPAGTEPGKAEEAARRFAADTFGSNKYRYIFSLHTDTENPHVHLVVKMVSEEGKRLSTGPKDLHEWRKSFAQKCREQGIDVEASYHYERGVGQSNEPPASRHIRKDNEKGRKQRKSTYAASIEKSVDETAKRGSYTATQREIAQLKRNLKERGEYLDMASDLRGLASSLEDKGRQKKLITMAAILEKEAKDMPLPRSDVQAAITSQDRLRGERTKVILPEADAKEIRDGLAKVSQVVTERQAAKEKSPDLSNELGD